ncbi:MAG: CRISPR system precrRNA processing endoribonuclease RAMP protein Cas6 [Roseburia sp.]|nr:CRISPR system precrRNA processing endoribonuclease RAMP protein Cas6 [Roseburia sp.]
MRLEVDRPEFGYYQSSNMQGVLMEQLDGGYAQRLHEQGLKPYSQCILSGEFPEWIVNTYTSEAYQKIMLPLLAEGFRHITLEKSGINISICAKELKTVSRQELLDEFYSEQYSRYLNLEFITPTSFKSGGKYVIMPDMRYIYQSLMNKYSASSADMEMYDEETLEQLVNCSSIVQYKLRSASFPMEGIRIPSFKGEIGIKIAGTGTMAKYARLLARFGEYSGIGIKTAIGMGALRIKRPMQERAKEGTEGRRTE